MRDVTSVELGDALETLIDHRGKTPKKLGGDWSADGHRVISALNIKDRRVNDNDHHYVDADMYKRWMRSPLRAGDVLLTSEAPLGEVAFLQQAEEWCLGQRLFGLRGKAGVLAGRYLFYALQFNSVRQQLLSRASGSTVAGIRQAELVKVTLELPSYQKQLAVSTTLGALDDKIESNLRLWQVRHRLAAAVYERHASTAAQWRPLAFYYGVGLSGVWGTDAPEGSSRVATSCLRGKDIEDYVLGKGIAPPHRFITMKQRASRSIGLGELWTAGSGTIGPTLLMTESVISAWPNEISNSNFVKRLVPHGDSVASALAWHAMRRSWASGEMRAYTTGTAMPNLDAAALLAGVQVPVLADDQVRELVALTEVALDAQPQRENVRLAEMRDVLLPELMSGRVRVPEAKAAVAELI